MEETNESANNQLPKPGWGARIKAKKYWIGKYLFNPFIVIPAIFLLFFISYYFIHFRAGKISDDGGAWSGFSEYLQMIFTFVNLILFAAIAITTYEYTKTSDVNQRKDDRRFQMPIIGFSRNLKNEYYNIRNLGKGGAFNIRVKTHFQSEKDLWTNCKIIHNMAVDSRFYPMEFTKDCNMICAIYEDLFGHKYFTFMEDENLLIVDTEDPSQMSDKKIIPIEKKVYKDSILPAAYIDVEI